MTSIRSTLLTLLLCCNFAAGATTQEPAAGARADATLDSVQTTIRRLLSALEYDRAIGELEQLRKSPEPSVRRFAQEYLGVVRERKGQLEFARLEYQRYLDEYPDSPEAARVRRRLDALIHSALPNREPVDTPPIARDKDAKANVRVDGSFGIDHRGSTNRNDAGDSERTLSLAGADLDLRATRENEESIFGARLSLGHYEDMLFGGRYTADRVRYLYAEYERDDSWRIRLGRQRARTSAIPGRFDGLDLRFELPWRIGVTVFAGLPVESSKAELFADERRFVGLELDTGDRFERAQFAIYGLQQSIASLVDRQVVGAELRYSGEAFLARAAADFDLHFNGLNAALLNLTRAGEKGSNFNFSYAFRKSPYLSTRNALIGQGIDSLEELSMLLTSADELEALAADRSLDTQTITMGYGRRMGDRITFSGSITRSEMSEGVSSGGLTASPQYSEVYGDTRFTVEDFMSSQQDLTFGIRYSQQDRANVISFHASLNRRTRGHWKLVPRLRVDQRVDENGSEQLTLAPGMRFEFQHGPHSIFLDSGYLMYTTTSPLIPDQRYTILFTYAGYRYRF